MEGVPQEHPRIVQHDYAEGPCFPLVTCTRARWDLAWCCEFVEHVEERFVPNFLLTLAVADLVLLTHADPGQGGYHHVNCRTEEYWTGALAAVGYELDANLTFRARALAALNASPWNHFKRSGLAFRHFATQ